MPPVKVCREENDGDLSSPSFTGSNMGLFLLGGGISG
jgi:hypothetical protein